MAKSAEKGSGRDVPTAFGAAHCALTFVWRHHPTRPLPFYVIDQQKVPNDEKLAWMKQELGSDADIWKFGAHFLELFGDKVRGIVPQKTVVFELWQLYSG